MKGMSARAIGLIAGLLFTILAVSLLLGQCQKIRSQGAQSRVERSQADAASNSAADAVGTVARSGEAAASSETLTRSNEANIRAADGADDRVKPAVRDAGIASLCRRPSYATDPRCHRP